MLLTPDEFSKAFERIKRTSLSHSTCKLVIFVSSLDVDAICASKMFTILLKKHLIVFQLIPVVGYADLKAKYLKLDDSITNLILIGCGSMVDLESFLEIDETQLIDHDYHTNSSAPITPDSSTDNLGERLRKHIYIIDGHRPWNLDNLFGSHVINCFDDGSAVTELENEKNAYQILVNHQEEEEGLPVGETDDDDEENGDNNSHTTHRVYEDLAGSDDDDNDGEERTNRRKTKRGLDSDSEDDEDDNNDDDDDELLLNGRKRRISGSQSNARENRKRIILENERTIESYYNQGTTVSTSSALQVYSLITEIGESSTDYLWLGIIGSISLSAAYSEMYDNIVPQLKDEVNRLHQTEDEVAVALQNEEGRGKNADNNKLTVERDYPLFLLRHWNLYNAFFYSNYINSRYQLYTSDGSKRLKTLFAKMGISLASANQSWHYLDINLKKKLNTIFGKNLSDPSWRDFFKEGFFRQFGFHGSISASDYFESLTALLEYDGDVNKSLNTKEKSSSRLNTPDSDSTNNSNNNNGEATDDDYNESSLTKSINKRETQFISNFWKSFDSLNDFEMILKGLKISKLQQKFIFDKGFEIFQKKLIKNFRVFRLVVLKDEFGTNNSILHTTGSSFEENDGLEITTLASNTRMFQNPLILKKLGNWLLDSCAELDSDLLPLVIASLDPETNTYMVLGLPPKYPKNLQYDVASRDKLTVLNTFPLAFQEIANTTNTKTRIDSFESCIIEVKKEDLMSFLEKLSLSGLV